MVKRYRNGCKGRAWDEPDMRTMHYAMVTQRSWVAVARCVLFTVAVTSFTNCDEETHSSVAVSETGSLAAFGE